MFFCLAVGAKAGCILYWLVAAGAGTQAALGQSMCNIIQPGGSGAGQAGKGAGPHGLPSCGTVAGVMVLAGGLMGDVWNAEAGI